MIHPCSILLASTKLTQGDIFSIIGIILLIICSAFCSASETAYSSSNTLRLKTLAEEKTHGARRAIYIVENFEKTLSCILTFNNLVNIACTSIAAYLFAKYVTNPTLANLLNTIVLTVVILIFGEILPKATAKKNPEKYALKFSGTIYFLLKYALIYYPFYFLQKLAFRKQKEVETPTVTEDELESIIDTMEEEGVIDHDNKEIIQGAINLSELSAYDVMTHRKDAIFIDVEATIDQVKKTFIDYQYSRIPVYKDTRDNIIGILNQKDLFTAISTNKKITIDKLMTKPHFVSEEMKLDDVIRELQKEKKHLAIVIDEQGGTSGLITMEDCLESIFGEIYDEHDLDEKAPDKIKKLDDGSFIIDADTEVDELFETLEIEHKPDTDYPTVGGFIFEIAEELLSINDEVKYETIDEQIDEHGNFINKHIIMKFVVTKVKDRKIQQVKLFIE